MKRKITFLIAAIAAIMLITQPIKVLGQEKAEGDEITSISNIVSGKTYYIKGTRTSGGNTVIEYLKFTDSAGSQSGTSSNNTDGAVAITFTNVSGNTWRLTTPSGNYIAPGTSNGKINVSSSVINVTASNQGNKIRLSITSNNETWSIQKNTSGTNFGGYKNTQTDITLIEAPASKVATPSFSPSANTYNETQNVTISCATDDASIYYTMGADPADPTSSSTPYTGAITVSANTTIKAIAIKDGMTDSNIASASYQIRTTAPSFTPVAGTYSVAKSVTLSAADGASIYYTMGTDPADPTSSSTHYTDAIDVTTTTTIKAIAIKDGYANSNISTATYTIINDPCTLTLNSNDVISTVIVPKNEEYTLPTPINVPVGYGYLGWSVKNEGIEDGDVKTTITPTTDDATYYAVYRSGLFSKVESTPANSDWSGIYLFVYEDGNAAFNGNLTTLDAASNTISVTITSKQIAYNSTTASAIFTIASKTGGFSIMSNSGKYIGQTSNANGLASSDEDDYTNSISLSGSNISVSSSSAYLRYNKANNQLRFRYYKSDSYTNQEAIQLYKLNYTGDYTVSVNNPTIPGDVEITTPTTISSSQTFSGDLDITENLTIENGAVVSVEGDITNTTAANLIIEDGGQLILANTNTGVAATVKKDVSAATAASKTDATYWYAISAGVENPSISSNTNLITESAGDPTYDLYRFNEAKNAGNAWENYRNSDYSATFTTLEKGRGYLYRNASDLTIAMTGDINVEDFTYNVTKTGSGEYAGFNLIGNPYTHDIYKGAGTAITSGTSTLSTGFYYLEPSTGKWAKGTDNSTAIAPNQGILVQVNETGNINMTNTNSNGNAKSHNDYIMLSVANSQYSDEAYAWFDKGIGLNKIEHRNSEIPMLYINQNGENFAIATMSDETQSFNLNFKAATMGKYTLSYETKGEYSYLHVIDRLTGEDVDMLLEGEYSFIASPIDSENRFIVRLEYSAGSEISESSVFAYQSGNDIIVNGEGELQIFDMMGRRVLTQYVSGVETINLQLNGVFIFKLNEKTQKIVVR
ncbi:MAG: chitobiase/beta-hexosaminidase C-terminal domain-containing protein [Bacteroidales bacterium]|nr:chitobiase/beta-hexosaminidase C-terminal domain-containing protein [Bacteroidales bacterium]